MTSRALAASIVGAALLIALALLPPARASAASGDLTGAMPRNGGVALIVWGGGPADRLVAAAQVRGCSVAAVWAMPASQFIAYVPGAPAAVNVEFGARYPAGIPASTPLLLVCARPSQLIVSASSINQGSALQVRVTHARSGSATLLGHDFALSADGEDLVGFVAAAVDDPPGDTNLSVTFVGVEGGEQHASASLTVLATQWTVEDIVLPPAPPPDPNAPPPPPPPPDEQDRLDALYRGVSPRLWRDGWASPLAQQLVVTSFFGEQRSYNGGPVGGHHGGTDFAVDEGTPIYATNDGTVVLAELTLRRGNLVVIDHGGGVFSAYAHMSRFATSAGERVTRGQLIGYAGSTGLATGPHLHWEMAVGGFLVDALRWLDGSQGF